MRSLRSCSDSSAIPSFPWQAEGKIVRVRVNHKYFGIPSVYTYPCYILHCYYYHLYFTNRGTRVWCVNFLDQLYWYTGCPPIWLNISGCICEGVCKRLAEWMNWVRQMVGIIQSLKAWIEWRKHEKSTKERQVFRKKIKRRTPSTLKERNNSIWTSLGDEGQILTCQMLSKLQLLKIFLMRTILKVFIVTTLFLFYVSGVFFFATWHVGS